MEGIMGGVVIKEISKRNSTKKYFAQLIWIFLIFLILNVKIFQEPYFCPVMIRCHYFGFCVTTVILSLDLEACKRNMKRSKRRVDISTELINLYY